MRSTIALSVAMMLFWTGEVSMAAVTRTFKAVNYHAQSGSTTVDFKGTDLMPTAQGEAKVEAKKGYIEVEVEFKNVQSPTRFGPEYLTYVLWAVTPEGRTSNMGELVIKDGRGKLNVTSELQVFAMGVTAEPYFAVTKPSDVVVMANEPRKDTRGKLFILDTKFELLERGHYQKMSNPLALSLDLKNVPLDMYQARNAVTIATASSSEKYAGEIFKKAQASLKMAENSLAAKAQVKDIATNARQAVQFAEDARTLSLKRQDEERIANEKAAAAAKAKADAEAKAAMEAAEAKRKTDAEASRQAELAAAREAQMKAEAEAARVKAEAEAATARAKAQAEADALKAKEQAALEAAARAEREKVELRARLLKQFNEVLDTRDSERGLVVNMSDVLFDSGQFTLRPLAREKLARLAGIVLNYPKLRLESEGHTDNVGSAEFNQTLSEKRAASVREYIITQGVAVGAITSVGRGFSVPVASNQTAQGRQQNRRVELIVSGEVIGTQLNAAKSQ